MQRADYPLTLCNAEAEDDSTFSIPVTEKDHEIANTSILDGAAGLYVASSALLSSTL